MSESTMLSNQASELKKQQHAGEINLIEYVRIVWGYRKLIVSLMGASLVIAIFYKATALISVGPIGKDEGGKYVSMLKGVAGGFFNNAGGASTDNLQIIGLFKTRALADHLIDTLDLMKEFGAKKRDSASATILSLLEVLETQEKFVKISVEYTDPKKAAKIVNEAIDYVDYMVNELNIANISNQRAFLEKRLNEVSQSLVNAEDTLRNFQEKHKLVDIMTQTSSTVNTLGVLNAQLIESETELGIKKQ